ncbi:hypothetical protein GE09DRAFT_1110450 [Coniochaeta sp. 2T2.1]|nr:hypothetical protein GE09DRAFT_1110450 [Coniochaeta sp. 2T2.1]
MPFPRRRCNVCAPQRPKHISPVRAMPFICDGRRIVASFLSSTCSRSTTHCRPRLLALKTCFYSPTVYLASSIIANLFTSSIHTIYDSGGLSITSLALLRVVAVCSGVLPACALFG